ncbi:MAG: hypothetical protein KJ072_17400 [Verrucomicrobia bacterium]|nr:hypothetical protein [Verrucomicrobiota bacterium]
MPAKDLPPCHLWRPLRCRTGTLPLLLATLVVAYTQATPEYELPPLLYSATEASNLVTRLDRNLLARHASQDTRNSTLLRATLAALEIPVESQVLVFSRTSLQRKLIHPQNPRALYFSDDAYLGWVPGGLMEIAVTDPGLGVAFYRMDTAADTGAVRIERDPDCLSCHAGPLTGQWPGLMIRSVYPDPNGEPFAAAGSFLTSHESPLAERWGGWYVTGLHGPARHLGNAIARDHHGSVELDREPGSNLTDLSGFVSTSRYLQPDSDLVALMILEHQVEMHNRLIRGALRTRRWLHYQSSLRKELGQPPATEPTGSAKVVIDSESTRIVEYLLFCDEIRLPESGVQGNHLFPAAFTRNRRPDPQGRSLKDLDLRTRLFAVRCSYMIYSLAFDNLPHELKHAVFLKLRVILDTKIVPPRFDHLGDAERTAIREILLATKPDLRAAWQADPLPVAPR